MTIAVLRCYEPRWRSPVLAEKGLLRHCEVVDFIYVFTLHDFLINFLVRVVEVKYISVEAKVCPKANWDFVRKIEKLYGSCDTWRNF